MLILQAVPFFLFLARNVICEDEAKYCPTCIDEYYMKFIQNNPRFFNDPKHRNYFYFDGVQNSTCLEDSYGKRLCQHSCLRIHLKAIENDKTESIGWMFDCSTDVIQKVPDTVLGIPSNLRNFSGDLHFEDDLNDHPEFRVVYDVTFFSASHDVESAKHYYRRRYEEEKKQLKEKQCQQDFINCLLRKMYNSKEFVCGLVVMAMFIIVAVGLKHWYLNKSQQYYHDPTSRVAFTRYENDMDEVILITDDLPPVYGSHEARA